MYATVIQYFYKPIAAIVLLNEENLKHCFFAYYQYNFKLIIFNFGILRLEYLSSSAKKEKYLND